MLKVNQIKAQILNTEFKFSRYILNGNVAGYQGFVMVWFELDGKKGYFDFYLNHIIAPKISCYENQSYCCVPIDDITEISYLEIFDTSNFYSWIFWKSIFELVSLVSRFSVKRWERGLCSRFSSWSQFTKLF